MTATRVVLFTPVLGSLPTRCPSQPRGPSKSVRVQSPKGSYSVLVVQEEDLPSWQPDPLLQLNPYPVPRHSLLNLSQLRGLFLNLLLPLLLLTLAPAQQLQ